MIRGGEVGLSGSDSEAPGESPSWRPTTFESSLTWFSHSHRQAITRDPDLGQQKERTCCSQRERLMLSFDATSAKTGKPGGLGYLPLPE